MIIGQIIYDVISPSGVRASTSDNDVKTIIYDDGTSSSYDANKIKITSDLVAKVSKGKFSKIGIQAPSGTLAVINGKNIQIGRTETYELDDPDLPIESLRFKDPGVKNLIIDFIINS